jgi:hypothetical protein
MRSLELSLQLSPAPVFLILGDNEWNDCPNVDEAYSFWHNSFDDFESKYWDLPSDLNVRRWVSLPENFAFEYRQTLFIGLNLVGGRVHDKAEWRNRLKTQYVITRDLINRYVDRTAESGIQRVVLFGHANPNRAHWHYFIRLRLFIHWKLKNRVPILYLNADGHEWKYDPEYMSQKSLLRIQVAGRGNEVPVRIQINPDEVTSNPEVAFEYERNSY